MTISISLVNVTMMDLRMMMMMMMMMVMMIMANSTGCPLLEILWPYNVFLLAFMPVLPIYIERSFKKTVDFVLICCKFLGEHVCF